LKEFPEIINAGAYDEQATQCISHCMEAVALNKENIDQGDDGIGDEECKECLFCAPVVDDFPEHI
jgi:hypothetical protein